MSGTLKGGPTEILGNILLCAHRQQYETTSGSLLALHVCGSVIITPPKIKTQRHLGPFTHVTHHIPLVERMYEYD